MFKRERERACSAVEEGRKRDGMRKRVGREVRTKENKYGLAKLKSQVKVLWVNNNDMGWGMHKKTLGFFFSTKLK